MYRNIKQVNAETVIVFDALGREKTIILHFTPWMLYLTQATKRAILATGCLLHALADDDSDEFIINEALEHIRQTALAQWEDADA